MDHLMLVDGSSYLYRAFHALPPLTNAEGQPTGAIYGVISMLRRMLDAHQPDRVIVVFDSPGPTTRHSYYPEYKANRGEMPEELVVQVEPLYRLIQALGLPLMRQQGVEADDLIGTIAVQAEEYRITIVTGDKDLAQLVNERISCLNTMTHVRLDVSGVLEKFGVLPSQIIDYLALMGDASDNIPGVPKVGPKTAVKWLNQYGSVAEIIAHAEEIKGKVGDNLRHALDQLLLSQRLVTIDTDVKLETSWRGMIMQAPDRDFLFKECTRLGFRQWQKEFEAPEKKENDSSRSYPCVTTEAAWQAWMAKCRRAKVFALDFETTSLDVLVADLVGVAIAISPEEACYVPIAHQEDAPQLPLSRVIEGLQDLLDDPSLRVIGHHLKYDFGVWARYGRAPKASYADTLLMSYILYGASHRHDMDTLAERYLGRTTLSYASVVKDPKTVTFDQVPIDQATAYAAEDASVTMALYQTFEQSLSSEPDLQRLLETLEYPLLSLLGQMERTGILLSSELLSSYSTSLAKDIALVEQEVEDLVGYAFNLASPKQLRQVLFDDLGLPVLKKTPKGESATSEESLQLLSDQHPLPQLILKHRHLSKLKNTYVDPLPKQVHERTQRVHTTFNQALTSTGRLSSHHPNLQNIPIKTEEGHKIREAFVAGEGYGLVAADYSQIELRLMAHFSKDHELMDAFFQGQDVHRRTASEVFATPYDAVSPDQRRLAKAINFGLIYGMSAFGLAKQLGITRGEASAYIEHYFAKYPGVKRYMEQTKGLAEEKGYVETLLKRRIYLPGIHSNNRMVVQGALRAAINGPLQGSSADLIKQAMLAMHACMTMSFPKVRMLLQVHDELVFEVPISDMASFSQQVQSVMEQVHSLEVPLVVEVASGKNWREAHG